MPGQGKGVQGDYQKYMSDFQQYMKGQGSQKGSAGDYEKYMSQYKQYMGQGGQGKAEAGDKKHIAQGSHAKHAKDESSKKESKESKEESKESKEDKDAPAAFLAEPENSRHLLFAPVLLVAVAASAFVYMEYQKRSLSSRNLGGDYMLQLEPMNV